MIETHSLESAEDAHLDEQYNKLSELVCEFGPKLLTRGMPAHEANDALIACLDHLIATRIPLELMAKLEEQKNEIEARARKAEKKLEVANLLVEITKHIQFVGPGSEIDKLRYKELMEDYHVGV